MNNTTQYFSLNHIGFLDFDNLNQDIANYHTKTIEEYIKENGIIPNLEKLTAIIGNERIASNIFAQLQNLVIAQERQANQATILVQKAIQSPKLDGLLDGLNEEEINPDIIQNAFDAIGQATQGGKKITRQEFLKTMGKVGMVALFSGAILNTLFAQDPDTTKDKNGDDNEKKEHGNEQAHEDNESHEHRLQAVYDATATAIFGGYIAPLFMKGDTAKALKLGAATISAYLAASGISNALGAKNHAIQHWLTEIIGRGGNANAHGKALQGTDHLNNVMGSSLAGTTLISVILNISEFMKLDVVPLMENTLNQKRSTLYKGLYESEDIKNIMSSLGISVDNNLDENQITIHNEESTIKISQQDFENILPFIVDNDLLSIEQYFAQTYKGEYDQIKSILEQNTDGIELTIPEITKKNLLTTQVGLFKEKISFLTSYILGSQLIFGVGQASVLKSTISQGILPELKNILISSGVHESDAIKLAMQFEAKLVSFWFNRFAYISDVGPLVACMQLGGFEGIGAMVKGMLPNVVGELFAFNNELKAVLAPTQHYLDTDMDIIDAESIATDTEQKLSNFKEQGSKIIEGVLDGSIRNLKDGAKTFYKAFMDVGGGYKNLVSGNLNRWGNEAFVNKKVRILEKKTEHSSTVEDVFGDKASSISNRILLPKKYGNDANFLTQTNTKNIIEDLATIQKHLQKKTLSFEKTPYTFDWLLNSEGLDHLEMLQYLYHIDTYIDANKTDLSLEDIDTIHGGIDKIINTDKFSWFNISRALHHHGHHMGGDEGHTEHHKASYIAHLSDFVTKYSNVANYAESMYNEEYFDSVLSNFTEQNSANKIDTKNFPGLDISVYPEASLGGGSASAKVNLVETNMKFLLYVKDKKPNFYQQRSKNCIDNLTKHQFDPKRLVTKLTGNELVAFQTICKENNIDCEPREKDKKRHDAFGKYATQMKDHIGSLGEQGLESIWDVLATMLGKPIDAATKGKITSVQDFINYGESYFGKSTFEVICMILFVQAPFVPPIVSTVKRIMSAIPKRLPKKVKKYLIGFITYFMSAFADNYVATKIGHALMKEEFPEMTDAEILQFISPQAILGGSNAITGNAPNAVIGTATSVYTTSANPDMSSEEVEGTIPILRFLGEMLYDSVATGASTGTDGGFVDRAAGIGIKIAKKTIMDKFANVVGINPYREKGKQVA